jgi:hypothetical protein
MGAQVRLPFEPLRAYVATLIVLRSTTLGGGIDEGRSSLWPQKSREYRAFERAQTAGWFTFGAADRMAVDLGLHPALIWGELWWDANAQMDALYRARRERQRPAQAAWVRRKRASGRSGTPTQGREAIALCGTHKTGSSAA